MRNSKELLGVAAIAAMACAALPTTAWGYGIELPESGAVAFGRGGAFMTRASDPSAVMHNVAGIAGLPGLQITLSSNVGRFSHCFQRTGNYQGGSSASVDASDTVFDSGGGNAAYLSGNVPYPEVCNEFSVALAPLVLGTYRINRMFALGIGVYAPSTTGSQQNYADTVTARDTMTGMSVQAPSPARNLLYQKNLLVLHPVIALAVAPTRWIRFGIGIEPSFGRFQFGLNVNAVTGAPQSPSSDVRINLDASGFFMAGSLSTQVLPTSFLSFAAQFHYNFGIDASGTANNVAFPYTTEARGGRIASSFTINSMQVNLPWTLRMGARYNHPRPGRPTQNDGTGTYDPMTDDVFDIEAMFTVEGTSSLSETTLANSGFINAGPILGQVPAPAAISIRSALSDVYGFRLGGDFNVIPGKLALRVGGAYETAGASPVATSIHLPAYAGGTVNAGLSYRWRWLTISAAYGHFFFQDHDASQGSRNITVPGTQITTCSPAQGSQACTINRGVYTAHMNSGSLQFTARF